MDKITINDLSETEMLDLCMGRNVFETETLNGRVPSVRHADASSGIRWAGVNNDKKAEPSLAYPCLSALGNSWNAELAKRYGAAVASDAKEKGIDVVLGPGINIKRYPKCGRNFEYLSEDPILTGVLARAYIEGMQENGVGACVKHYCLNNQENGRHWKSSNCDIRTIRELYLEAFEIALEAKPYEIMCSYNLLNGVRMSENEEYYTIARDEYGFDGLFVSDWGAVKDPVKSLNATLTLEMPYDQRHRKELRNALENGKISEDSLRYNANKVLELASKCDTNKKAKLPLLSLEERERIALETEEEGIVLLKNEGGTLPLKKDARILFCGAPTDHCLKGNGSSEVTPLGTPAKLDDELRNAGCQIETVRVFDHFAGHQASVDNVPLAYRKAKEADVTLIWAAEDGLAESESRDRNTIRLPRDEEDVILQLASVSKKTVVLLEAGSAIDMSVWIDKVDAVLYCPYGGERFATAVKNILLGTIAPSGRLSETFPIHESDLLSMHSPHNALGYQYAERQLVGYRQFVARKEKPLFPFGYGLSYTEFAYSDFETHRDGDAVIVSFKIKNAGSTKGKDVPQIYVRDCVDPETHSFHKLKAFAKIELAAGEEKEVMLCLDKRAFRHFDATSGTWAQSKGEFEISLCKSALDIVFSKKVKL